MHVIQADTAAGLPLTLGYRRCVIAASDIAVLRADVTSVSKSLQSVSTQSYTNEQHVTPSSVHLVHMPRVP